MAVRVARTTHQHVKIMPGAQEGCNTINMYRTTYNRLAFESLCQDEQHLSIITISFFGYILVLNTLVRRFLVSQAYVPTVNRKQ